MIELRQGHHETTSSRSSHRRLNQVSVEEYHNHPALRIPLASSTPHSSRIKHSIFELERPQYPHSGVACQNCLAIPQDRDIPNSGTWISHVSGTAVWL